MNCECDVQLVYRPYRCYTVQFRFEMHLRFYLIYSGIFFSASHSPLAYRMPKCGRCGGCQFGVKHNQSFPHSSAIFPAIVRRCETFYSLAKFAISNGHWRLMVGHGILCQPNWPHLSLILARARAMETLGRT